MTEWKLWRAAQTTWRCFAIALFLLSIMIVTKPSVIWHTLTDVISGSGQFKTNVPACRKKSTHALPDWNFRTAHPLGPKWRTRADGLTDRRGDDDLQHRLAGRSSTSVITEAKKSNATAWKCFWNTLVVTVNRIRNRSGVEKTRQRISSNGCKCSSNQLSD